MTDTEQKTAAKAFADRWKDRGYEKGESQSFWIDLLTSVFGVSNFADYINFEEEAHLDNTSFIDAVIPSTRVMIEQKSITKDLSKPIRQSDGSVLTPFQQAKRYITEMPVSQHPLWVITCNFNEFHIYNMDNPKGEPEKILLKDLPTEYYRLQFMVDTKSEHIAHETEVSIAAGDIVGQLYDAFAKQYKDISNVHSQHSLNVLCVRLVFCLYAEDADIFGKRDMFHDYMAGFKTSQMRKALVYLFKILDTPEDARDPYLADDNPDLAAFPYVNGGLFSDEDIEVPPFTDEIRELLLNRASLEFDWSVISPTIFGAVFESTLNPETRRSGGMHYTSIENIHKVIDPLFLNDLRKEFKEICAIKAINKKVTALKKFQGRLASLCFLDPACGSGNFLTETYLSLRRLENKAIEEIQRFQPKNRDNKNGQIVYAEEGYTIRVSLDQFFGIEINDFAVTVAKTALWIAEAQMKNEAANSLFIPMEFFPLKSNTNIVEGNAVLMDWEEVVPKSKLTYIMGNPPFVGARLMSQEQKNELNYVFGDWKNAGNLDYVTCWYKKSADYMEGTGIRAALVSTNSVTQGESVANLWKPLFERGIHIDYAYRSFMWDSEAKSKAHVYCVIVGFSYAPNSKDRIIYSDGRPQIARNINGYLIDADNVFVESRKIPICNAPEMGIGNKPIDGGYYLFTKDEMEEFISKEPASAKYFRPWYGAEEFIHNKPRYCLWLGDCTPAEINSMPHCRKRVEAVRNYRLQSKSAGTRKIALKPTRFHVENMPASDHYLLIPSTTSAQRKYVPIGFMSKEALSSNLVLLVPDATLYHFGVLTSNVHMAWMRAVAGRLGMGYRYSCDIVYNNFPWPNPTPQQMARIEQTAQAILDARKLYPDSTLADLYDDVTMPVELRNAHRQNDRAVMEAYGFDVRTMTESSCVAELFKRYKSITSMREIVENIQAVPRELTKG
ncbi:MAG: N-6 DNA methylase [Clostridia bacterium]|nr:N-6 DNA methylase [Clostridia bacterium]